MVEKNNNISFDKIKFFLITLKKFYKIRERSIHVFLKRFLHIELNLDLIILERF